MGAYPAVFSSHGFKVNLTDWPTRTFSYKTSLLFTDGWGIEFPLLGSEPPRSVLRF